MQEILGFARNDGFLGIGRSASLTACRVFNLSRKRKVADVRLFA